MPRKGSEKRRTGCTTCKKRRVKCDECRPICTRCRSGNRKCSYLEPPVGSFTWHQLLKTRPSTISPPPSAVKLPAQQVRSLDYFRHIVAPSLAGRLDSSFWTKPVLQLAMSEAAALHGMLAISTLYENFDPGWKSAKNDGVALKHYNYALRLVAEERNTSVVLIVSILFTCIEFLRGDRDAAITHCRHGIILANSPVSCDADVSPVLRHLGIFPYFFANGQFPALARSAPIDRFEDVSAAAMAMDELLGRAIRLVRSLDGYRLGFEGSAVDGETWDTQRDLLRDLTRWKGAFEALLRQCSLDGAHSLLLMRFLVCWIWTNIAPYKDETASDAYHPQFAHIVKLAADASAEQACDSRFTFGMGISPLLHFVVIKCRHLSTRLGALEALRRMGRRRESLWDAVEMCAIGKCIIEREHGVEVLPGIVAEEEKLPKDERRIRDSYLEDEVYEDQDDEGHPVLRRRIILFVRDGSAIVKQSDWISIHS